MMMKDDDHTDDDDDDDHISLSNSEREAAGRRDPPPSPQAPRSPGQAATETSGGGLSIRASFAADVQVLRGLISEAISGQFISL